MPRYFFHFVSKDDFIPDYDGAVLSGLKAAHGHAVRLVAQTLPILADEDPRHWKIEIADERQFVLLTVLFPAPPPGPGRGLGRAREAAPIGIPVRPKSAAGKLEPLARPPDSRP
jgi:hypothetical protein